MTIGMPLPRDVYASIYVNVKVPGSVGDAHLLQIAP